MQKRRLFASFVLALTAVLPLSSFAAYLDKLIRLIVPAAAGSEPDILMRTLATQLSQQMGVPFIIDNKPGASSSLVPWRSCVPRLTDTRLAKAKSCHWPPTEP